MIAEGLAAAESPKAVIDFRNRLLDLALAQFDAAEQRKGTQVQPALFYRRGKIKLDAGDFDGAGRDFQMALRQAQIHTFDATRQEMTMRSRYALGLVEWHRANYPAARDYLQLAFDGQTAAGAAWVPDLERHLARARALAGGP